MLRDIKGCSSTVLLKMEGKPARLLPVRQLLPARFIVAAGWEGLRHDQHVVVHYNFLMDGELTFVKQEAQIKLDTLHGVGVEFHKDSTLHSALKRLLTAQWYERPCQFLVAQMQMQPALRGN